MAKRNRNGKMRHKGKGPTNLSAEVDKTYGQLDSSTKQKLGAIGGKNFLQVIAMMVYGLLEAMINSKVAAAIEMALTRGTAREYVINNVQLTVYQGKPGYIKGLIAKMNPRDILGIGYDPVANAQTARLVVRNGGFGQLDRYTMRRQDIFGKDFSWVRLVTYDTKLDQYIAIGDRGINTVGMQHFLMSVGNLLVKIGGLTHQFLAPKAKRHAATWSKTMPVASFTVRYLSKEDKHHAYQNGWMFQSNGRAITASRLGDFAKAMLPLVNSIEIDQDLGNITEITPVNGSRLGISFSKGKYDFALATIKENGEVELDFTTAIKNGEYRRPIIAANEEHTILGASGEEDVMTFLPPKQIPENIWALMQENPGQQNQASA